MWAFQQARQRDDLDMFELFRLFADHYATSDRYAMTEDQLETARARLRSGFAVAGE